MTGSYVLMLHCFMNAAVAIAPIPVSKVRDKV